MRLRALGIVAGAALWAMSPAALAQGQADEPLTPARDFSGVWTTYAEPGAAPFGGRGASPEGWRAWLAVGRPHPREVALCRERLVGRLRERGPRGRGTQREAAQEPQDRQAHRHSSPTAVDSTLAVFSPDRPFLPRSKMCRDRPKDAIATGWRQQ